MRIKIFLDPDTFYIQKYGGISRIFAEFWSECKQRNDIEIICPVFYSENLHLKEKNLLPDTLSFLRDINPKIKKNFLRPILKRISFLYYIYHLRKHNYDIFLSTAHNPYFLNHIKNKPFIVTVYDMIYELYPNYFKDEKIKENKKILIEKASSIIAISQSTKNDICRLYPQINPSKIDVVYLAYTLNKEPVKLDWLPKQYFLFVGNRTLYKRFDIFVKATLPLLKQFPDLKIVCAGGGSFASEEINYLSSLNIKERFIQYNFEDNEIYTLYHNAVGFVFSSEYEGFGIPALESMASGCPTVLSKSSSLPEIGENAALYFQPNNDTELSEILHKLLTDKSFREEKINQGYEQEKKFSWEKTNEQYISIINKVVNKL